MILVRGNYWLTAINYALLVISILFILFGLSQQLIHVVPFSAEYFETRFNASQWVDPLSQVPISDQELYVYNGYRLINGHDPTLISPEVPPLGKYLIGLSLILTGHYAPLSIAMFLGCAYLIYALTKYISSSTTAGLIALFFTAIHPIFQDQIREIPQLDLFQVFFMLSATYSYLLYHTTKKFRWLFSTGVLLGGFVSVKVAFLYGVLLAGWLGLFYLVRLVKKNGTIFQTARESIILMFCALRILIFSYTIYFVHGNTALQLLGVQKWIMHFYSSSSIESIPLMGNYLLLIATGHWWVWSPGYPLTQYEHWTLIWPLSFILGWTSLLNLKNSSLNTGQTLLVTFVIVYSIFLYIIPMFPRYLVLLFIPLNILIGIYFDRILLHGKKS